jgi:hypothetical protein
VYVCVMWNDEHKKWGLYVCVFVGVKGKGLWSWGSSVECMHFVIRCVPGLAGCCPRACVICQKHAHCLRLHTYTHG